MADRVQAGPDDLSELGEVTLAVRDLVAATQQLAGRTAQATGQNVTDMTAVGLLVQFGPMGVVELGNRLGIRSASATALVDRLERAGHAERVRDRVDRRRVAITATDAARRANLEAWIPLVRRMDEVCRDLSPAEADVVVRFLRRLATTVDGSVP